MKVHFILLAIIFSITTSYGQYSVLKGTIYNATLKQKLSGASVYISDTALKSVVVSANNGFYIIKNIKPGNYTLKVKYLGFLTVSKNINLKDGTEETVDFYLKENYAKLNDVVIFSKLNEEEESSSRISEKKANNIQNIVSAKVIERSPDISTANVLQRMSGVTIDKNSGGDEAYAIVRGLEPRYNNTLINGVKVASTDPAGRYVTLDIIPSEVLQKIEVSKSLLPEMEGDAIGGSVNLVMKDAPDSEELKANVSLGYNSIFFDRKFLTFSKYDIQSKSVYDRFGAGYVAQPGDFSRSNLDFKEVNGPPCETFGITYGNRFLHKKLGLMIGESFQNEFYGVNSSDQQVVAYLGNYNVSDAYVLKYSNQQLNNSFTTHLDYSFNDHNKITLSNLFLYSYLAQATINIDTAITGGNGGRTVPGTGPINTDYTSSTNQQFVDNLKLEGKHILSKHFLIDWAGVYSVAYKITPDQADLSLNKKIDTVNNPNGGYTFFSTPNYYDGITRIWQHNNDQDFNIIGNLTYKLPLNKVFIELKTGGLYRSKTKYNRQNQYDLQPVVTNTKPPFYDIYSTQWTVYDPKGTAAYDIHNYNAYEYVSAFYVQAKFSFKLLDVFGGVRSETTDQGFNVNRIYPGAINAIKKNYVDLLPSLMFKYKLNNLTNIRLSYFKGISRPQFNELVPTSYTTIGSPIVEVGNPYLRHTVSDNFDFRYELYPKDEEQLFVGFFYKKLVDPIEWAFNDIFSYTPSNLGVANIYGPELVYLKYFGRIGISGNYSYSFSSVNSPKTYTDTATRTTIIKNSTRPLQGQTDHVLNLSLLYRNKKKDFFIQLAYQYLGKTLTQVSPLYNTDFFSIPQHFLDISAEKQIDSHFIVFCKLNNLLNTTIRSGTGNLVTINDKHNSIYSIGIRFSKNKISD